MFQQKYDSYYPLSELNPAYVRAAGHTAWMSVILACIALFKKREKSYNYNIKKDFKDVKQFQKWLTKIGEKKLLKDFNDLYSTLHLRIGYDAYVRPVKMYKEFKKIANFITKIEARI